MSGKPRGANHICKRPVSFGNPALGTYHGFVYTEERTESSSYPSSSSSLQHEDHKHPRPPLIEGASEARCLVAMLDVPPEQVPEGILNLAQPHRPWIHHVRIVIAEPANHKTGGSVSSGHGPGTGTVVVSVRSPSEEAEDRTKQFTSYSPSPNASAMENAASILAAEHELETATEGSIISTSSRKYTGNAGNIHTTHAAHAAAGAGAAPMDHEEIQNQANSKHRQHDRPNRSYLVLIELSTEDAAAEIVQDLDGQPYTILDEAVTCSVHHVVALEGVAGVSLMSPFFAPPSGKLEILPSHPTPASDSSKSSLLATVSESQAGSTTKPAATATATTSLSEDYNCAVCLEHMDLDSPHTSILTTVCNHSFHMDCLMQWQDSPCPVCRYDHSGLNEALSQCHLCGTTEYNYVCLICGVVSCGGASVPSVARRPDSSECASSTSISTTTTTAVKESLQASQSRVLSTSHARQHYNDTLHAYALCTETQHVWDFAGNGYVHRLLQNKEDGKLVEVNDPSNTTSHERSLSPGLSGAQEEQVVHRKLEGFASQYYTLLKSQLEQQRIFYEGRLEEIRREYAHNNPRVSTSDWIAALRQEHHQLSQRLGSVQAKCRSVQEDVAFIKSLNESLEANREPLREQVERAQSDRVEARKMFDECLPPLEEKVTKLMLQLESSFDGGVGARVGAVGDDQNTCFESAGSSPKKPAAL